ncbi:unnamed protein product [Mytilus coruscus]|uniref:Uncharacterized protein n=1 Tax=Mytilus coruscus TaxID=42192 RepID=A0A6J8E444_MYTCO|nr:unnamed protein product [Mytilus coruscus]
MAYRAAEHETTGTTQKLLMLGRETTMPLDLMYCMPTSVKPVPTNLWIWELKERIEDAHTFVRAHMKQAILRQKTYYDKKLSWLIVAEVASHKSSIVKGLRKKNSQILREEDVDLIVNEPVIENENESYTDEFIDVSSRDNIRPRREVMVKTKVTPRLTKEVKLVMKETCPLYKKEYIDRDKLKNHVLTCAQDKSRLTCYQCNQMFKKHEDVKIVEVPHDKKEKKEQDVPPKNVPSKDKDDNSDESDSFCDDSESSSDSGKEFSDPGDFDDEKDSPRPENDKSKSETVKISDKVCLEGRITRKPTRPEKVLAPRKEKLLELLKESSNKQEIEGKIHCPDLFSDKKSEITVKVKLSRKNIQMIQSLSRR